MNDIETVEPEEVLREEVAAADAERDLTDALAALKRRGERVITRVETAITPRRIAIGVSVAVGLGALVWLARASPRRGPRRTTVAGAVAQSLAREVVGRLLLGAAATVGARLAEAAVPMVIAAVSARQATRPARSRKRKSAPPVQDA